MAARVPMSLAVLAAVGLACSSIGSFPQAPTGGPAMVEDISVPVPADGSPRLTISFGAGELNLAPGASGLVEGTATYNHEALKPELVSSGDSIEIKQGDPLRLLEPRAMKNTWDLKLGAAPMTLRINAGAYEGNFELGGLALTELTIKDGAANVGLSFAAPNQSEMTVLRYETGASDVKMTGLANANFSTMTMSSGAGDYTLDFSGDLQRDAAISITTGLSNLILVVPEDVSAVVTAETGLSNIVAGSSWSQDGNRYAQPGTGPTLTFIIKGGAGNLTLTH
jgi:hypothetical protein